MAIVLNSNVAALNANRRLSENTAQLNRTFTRLSSGLRINRAGDDAAGLAIAASLNADSRVYNQAIRNVNDGISYVDIAEGATSELKNILVRMRELATQASNGTYGDGQRTALDAEVQSLSAEYNRIIRSVEFNGASLFTTGTDLYVQAGYGTAEQLRVALGYEVSVTSGTGTFGASTSFSATSGGNVNDMSIGDVDGDGDNDIVSAKTNGTIVVSLSNGNGTFKSGVTYAETTGTLTWSVVTGDFNGDGKLDVISGNYSGSTQKFYFYVGNGNGSFNSPVSYDITGANHRELAAADLDGDGDLDLVSVNASGTNTTKVILGNGNGTFLAPVSLTASAATDTWDVQIEDIDANGTLDIVALERGARKVLVYLGNGNATFSAPMSFVESFSGAPEGLDIADVNGDGKLDFIAADAGGLMSIGLGNGNGTFLAPTTFALTGTPKRPAAFDFNGDGKLDVAVSIDATTRVAIFLGNGNGSFAAPRTYTLNGTSIKPIAVFDTNGDGVADITVGSGTTFNVLLSDTATSTTSIRIREISGISVNSRANALAAQGDIDTYFTELNGVLGIIGASSSRLDTVVRTIGIRRENFQAAASQITDADVAEETANLVKSRLLQQAATAILVSANQLPSLALNLLGSG